MTSMTNFGIVLNFLVSYYLFYGSTDNWYESFYVVYAEWAGFQWVLHPYSLLSPTGERTSSFPGRDTSAEEPFLSQSVLSLGTLHRILS